MARRPRFVFLILMLAFAGAVWLFQRDVTGSGTSPDAAGPSWSMQTVTLVGLPDDNAGHYRLSADTALFTDGLSVVDLAKPSFAYVTPKTSFSGTADVGVFDGDVITISGNVEGRINGVDYVTGTNGELVYHLDNDSGSITGGVTFAEPGRSITADGATFTLPGEDISFSGGVRVDYRPTD